ncbi:MAG TPA: N,N-dimethylformamidase beta subunit family domain-containing protein [Gemmata sp.]|nr:N,N-dimethylformamidase beta subunit family domain-containing protein [Gemmata sp.]
MRPLVSRRTALKTGAALAASAALPIEAAAQKPKLPVVEGYTDQLSYAPGEEVRLHLSASADTVATITVVRIGQKEEIVCNCPAVKVAPQPVPKDASSHGCKWPVAHTFKESANWPTGYYLARLALQGPNESFPLGQTFFVVRPDVPGKRAKILLQLSTNTYNAYTNWGGYSLYAYNGRHKVQGRRVSFDRPLSSQFAQWEEPFIRWAEAAGYAIDYCVNSDLEFHPELLKPYKLVLSVGHDEYWSSPMRDNLENYIKEGGNVAFFSGNVCCWQVRSEENGRALACWKQSFGDDPFYKAGNYKLLSSLWSHYLVGRPENSLTGVGFLWGGYHRSHGQFMDGPGSFIAHRPDHWLFAGTNLNRGDRFGASLPKYKVVGYECDGCELVWKDGLPFPTHNDGTPKDFEVLATCPARWHPDDCEWYEKWEKGRTGNAVVGTYTRGGTVVTVGTTDWSHGLRGNDAAVVKITKNVLDRLGK